MRKKRILILLNETASRVWRVFPNVAYLREERGWEVEKIEANEKIQDSAIEWADVVFQEMGLNHLLPKRCRKLNTPFVYDIDDLITTPPKNHPDYHKLSRPIVRLRTWRTIHHSDLLITSNDYLAQHYKWAFPGQVEVFGNYMELGYWEHSYRENTTDTVRIGWTGSPSHYEDLKFIEPIIAGILKDYDNVKFVYMGMGGQRSKKNPHFEFQVGKDIFDTIPDDRREYVMGVPWEHYPARLASLQLDIGLAPVLETKFGKAKTPIKWMEYGINKVPTVASNHLYGAPYIHSGVDGLAVDNSHRAWDESIRYLLDNPDARRRMGRSAFERVRRDFNMNDHVGRWADIIERVAVRNNPDLAT